MTTYQEAVEAITKAVESLDADDEWMCTSWLLVRSSVRPADAHEGVAAYSYAIPNGQAIHVTRGLIACAAAKWDHLIATDGGAFWGEDDDD